MTYQQSLDYLNSFINHEKSKSFAESEFSLEPMQRLIKLLDLDLAKLKIVHIAGTKGKGSTAQMLAYALSLSSYSVGLFSSPHIVSIRERIKILHANETMISEQDFAKICLRIKKILAETDFKPSYFELLSALAFVYYLESEIDFLVLETGLGGRFDATNVVDPILSIITSIALEHTEILGDTYDKIAHEKSGIVKRDRPVIIGDMPKLASDTILERAIEQSSRAYLYGRDFFAENIQLKRDNVSFEYRIPGEASHLLTCTLASRVQAKNAALVVKAIEILKLSYKIEKTALTKALSSVSILGRYTELNYNSRKIIADIAHTKESLADLIESVENREDPKKAVYVFGANRDKNFNGMLNVLKNRKLIFTSADNPRAIRADELDFKEERFFYKLTENIDQAFIDAEKISDPNSYFVVTGSAYLVADLIKYINKEVDDGK